MRQVRHNVFETNSSSVHTFTLDGTAEDNITVDDDGYIYLDLAEFDGSTLRYEDSYAKLQYLVDVMLYVHCIYTPWRINDRPLNAYVVEEWNDCISDLTDTADWRQLEHDVIDHYVHEGITCKGIRINISYGYIDHQSQNAESVMSFLEECGCETIEQFIWGIAAINTSHD